MLQTVTTMSPLSVSAVSVRRRLRFAAALSVTAALLLALPGGPAHAAPAPAPATDPDDPGIPSPVPVPTPSPSRPTAPVKTTPPVPITLPLTARVVTWPAHMIAAGLEGGIPPILELAFGVKERFYELSMSVGIFAGPIFGSPNTAFGMTLSMGFYSLRKNRVRLRHGFSFGVATEVVFEKRQAVGGISPLPFARIQALDVLVRLGGRVWLEISPLTAAFPGIYELSLGLRYEFAEPRRAKPRGQAETPAQARDNKNPRRRARARWFLSVEQGLLWWQHYEQPVLGATFGKLGLRYRWFEAAVGMGSPAWATWRARGLYEIFADVAFYSLRRARLRLRHQVRLGLLFHNPPFEPHTWSLVVLHADFCTVAFGLGHGFWAEVTPLRLAIAPRDQLSTSVALRYEF